jgi:hypothetical protein
MRGTEPVGLLKVVIVYERPAANRVVCHARCVSVGRSVFPGDSVLPLDSPQGSGVSPARVVRIHRLPVGEFTELTPGWSAVIDLEAPEGTDLSWVQPMANLRVVLPAARVEDGQAG